jgi:single-strand DNA-binding protein
MAKTQNKFSVFHPKRIDSPRGAYYNRFKSDTSLEIDASPITRRQRSSFMYQQITLVGNLGSDPEMRYTPSGVPVTTFSLAVNKSWTTQDGQRQDKTTWFRITAWRAQAETCSKYLSKGRQVLVIGEVEEAKPWTDKDGNTRASLEVTAQIVRFIGSRADSVGGTSGQSAQENHSDVTAEEDIPF